MRRHEITVSDVTDQHLKVDLASCANPRGWKELKAVWSFGGAPRFVVQSRFYGSDAKPDADVFRTESMEEAVSHYNAIGI